MKPAVLTPRALAVAKIALYLAAFMGVLDNAVVYLALPAIERDLHTGIADQQWIVGIYILMQGSFTLAAGALGDLYGRKRIFLTGLVLFIAGSIACGFAPNGSLLVAGRFLGGLGSSVLFSLSLAMILALFKDPKMREAGVRGFGNVAGIGAVAAPLVGGVCVSLLGWRSVFFINVPFAIFSIVATMMLIEESTVDRTRKLDVPGQITNVIGLLAFSFVLTEGNALGWTSPAILVTALVGCLAIAGFLRIEQRSPDPMLRLKYFENPVFAGANLMLMLNGMQYYGMFLVASLFLQSVQNLSSFVAGLYLFPAMLSFFLVNQASGKATARLGLARTGIVGMSICCVLVAAYLAVSLSTGPWVIALILAVWCIGAGLFYTPTETLGMGAVGDDDSGMAAGMLGFSLSFGGVLGIGLVGALLAAGMTVMMRVSLSAAGVPEDVAQTLLVAAHHGGIWTAIDALHPTTVPKDVLLHMADTAFAAGMRIAILAVAVISFATLAAVYVLFRRGRAFVALPKAESVEPQTVAT